MVDLDKAESAPEEPEKSDATMTKVFGDYEILKPIGKGKFAIVYRALRRSDNLIVALKKINVDAIDQKARDKCLKEVGLLQSLDHPNVIRYLDSFITDNDLVIIVEWAAAGDLKRQLRKAQERGVGFEERMIWKYFSQIADAIKHMHERRIMHRDLKPANIFLTLDGTVKVGDLGLSREFGEHTFKAHSRVGTPLYMAPEVLHGDGYDFKSDIWSLGCLLYELTVLKSPFKSEGLNLYSLFQKISQGDYQPLPEKYSQELRILAYSMIATKSEDRPDIADVCVRASALRQLTANGRKSSSESIISAIIDDKENKDSKEIKEDGNEKINTLTNLKLNSNDKLGDRSIPEKEPLTHSNSEIEKIPIRNDIKSLNNGENKSSNESCEKEKVKIKQENKSEMKFSPREEKKNEEKKEIMNNEKDKKEKERESDKVRGKEKEKERQENRERGSRVSSDSREVNGRHDANSNGVSHLKHKISRSKSDESDKEANIEKLTIKNGQSLEPRFVSSNRKNTEIGNNGDGNTYHHRNNNSISRTKGFDFSDNNNLAPSNTDLYLKNDEDSPYNTDAFTKKNSQAPEHLMSGKESDKDKIKSKEVSLSCALALMDNLYTTLVVLQYPMRDPKVYGDSKGHSVNTRSDVKSNPSKRGRGLLLPIHFACDLSDFGTIAGNEGTNQYFQFRRMASVCVWLLSQIGGECAAAVADIDLIQDAPLTVARQLLSLSQVAGVAPKDLSDILPTSLIYGYGEKTCSLLLMLCEILLLKIKHSWLPFKYESQSGEIERKNKNKNFAKSSGWIEDNVEEDENGGLKHKDVDAEEDDMDSMEASTTDGVRRSDCLSQSQDINSITGSQHLGYSMLVPSSDPTQWREETERVANKLKNADTKNIISGSWMGHLTVLKEFVKNSNIISSSSILDAESDKNNSVDNSSLRNSQRRESRAVIVSNLNLLKNQLNDQNSIMKRNENIINTREKIASLSREYSENKKAIDIFHSRIAAISIKIENRSNESAEMEQKLEEVLEALNSKTGGDGQGRDVGEGGSSIVIRLRNGIKTLKDEINLINIQTGVLSSILLTRNALKSKENFREKLKKQNQKLKNGKFKGSLKSNNDVDSGGNDDDD